MSFCKAIHYSSFIGNVTSKDIIAEPDMNMMYFKQSISQRAVKFARTQRTKDPIQLQRMKSQWNTHNRARTLVTVKSLKLMGWRQVGISRGTHSSSTVLIQPPAGQPDAGIWTFNTRTEEHVQSKWQQKHKMSRPPGALRAWPASSTNECSGCSSY